ncbi:MAG: MFS transporter [Pseudomonadota bacterium]
MRVGAPSGALVRAGGFYAAMFGALGVHLPFWPLWLSDWGLSEGEIGAYAAAGFALRLVAGLGLPVLADRRQARRAVLGATAAAGAALFLGHLWIESRGVLLVATMLTAGAFAAMLPIGDALGVAAARDFGFDYGRARSAGSAAFLGMNIGMGAAIGWLGADAALWAIAGFLALAGWLGATHPGGGRVKAGPRPSWGEMRGVVTRRAFVLFALASGLAQSSHGVIYAYGSVHWRGLGISEGTIGMLWAAGVAAEIVLMAAFGGWLTRRLGAAGALMLSGAAGVVRWGAMTLEPTVAALWALQAGHALTFAAAHLGAMAFLAAAVPDRVLGAAQAIKSALGIGVLMAATMGAAALIYPAFGAGAWWLGAAMSAGALVAAWAAGRAWDGRMLSP